MSALELLETDSKISDIAYKYDYETSDSFTKAFTRFHGVSPRLARRNKTKLKMFNPLKIKLIVEGGRSMEYKIIETKKQKFIAVVKSFSNEIINDENNHDVPDFWSVCQNKGLIDKLLNLKNNGKKDLYGLCTPSKEGESTFNYGIGVLVDENTSLEDIDEFTIWDVEEGTYVEFDCVGEEADSITNTWSYFFKEFLPQTGYKVSERTDYEVYYENNKDGVFCELFIPIEK